MVVQVGDGVISEIVHRIYSCGKSGQSSVNINEWEFSGDQVTRIPLQINSDGDQGSIVGKPHFERRNKILFALTVFKYTDSSRQWPTCKLEIKAKGGLCLGLSIWSPLKLDMHHCIVSIFPQDFFMDGEF